MHIRFWDLLLNACHFRQPIVKNLSAQPYPIGMCEKASSVGDDDGDKLEVERTDASADGILVNMDLDTCYHGF